MKQLKLDDLYRHYLATVKLDERKMGPTQRIETKRAFAAGVSSLLANIAGLMQDPSITEEQVIRNLKELEDELGKFWEDQV